MKAVLGALVIVVMATAPAMASNKQRAREEFRIGLQHYNLGEFKEALETFKSAYRDYDDPSFLFNIAQCERMLGEKGEAIRSYRAYLRESGDSSKRAEVLKLVSSLEAALREEGSAKAQPPSGVLQPHETDAAPPPASPSGKSAPASPPPSLALPASPAAHDEPPAAASSSGAASEGLVVTAAPKRRPAYKKWWVWTLVGIGVAGAAVGVALAVTLHPTSYPSAGSSDGTFRF
ncbi:MAG TPA: tetratricopeptide repeat protein [Polyangia bacterium]|jgi:hypothetical protein